MRQTNSPSVHKENEIKKFFTQPQNRPISPFNKEIFVSNTLQYSKSIPVSNTINRESIPIERQIPLQELNKRKVVVPVKLRRQSRPQKLPPEQRNGPTEQFGPNALSLFLIALEMMGQLLTQQFTRQVTNFFLNGEKKERVSIGKMEMALTSLASYWEGRQKPDYLKTKLCQAIQFIKDSYEAYKKDGESVLLQKHIKIFRNFIGENGQDNLLKDERRQQEQVSNRIQTFVRLSQGLNKHFNGCFPLPTEPLEKEESQEQYSTDLMEIDKPEKDYLTKCTEKKELQKYQPIDQKVIYIGHYTYESLCDLLF